MSACRAAGQAIGRDTLWILGRVVVERTERALRARDRPAPPGSRQPGAGERRDPRRAAATSWSSGPTTTNRSPAGHSATLSGGWSGARRVSGDRAARPAGTSRPGRDRRDLQHDRPGRPTVGTCGPTRTRHRAATRSRHQTALCPASPRGCSARSTRCSWPQGGCPPSRGKGQEERNERWPGSRAQAYNSHGLIIQTDIHGWVRVRDLMMDGTTAVVTAERVADGQEVTFRTPGERWYLTTPERP